MPGLVGELMGSVNAEHGVGTAKREYLHLTRSQTELAVMRALKAALDPGHRLNPGRVLARRTSEPAAGRGGQEALALPG